MITITHTHADGTLISGSSKGDGVYDVLRGLRDNWRYFPSIRQIGLGQSRDRSADPYKIRRAAEALRAAGHDVTVTVDESQRRTVAEVEADRAGRAEARAERYEERSERVGAQAMADYTRARTMAEAIPFGQPMMPDHYSYGRDRRYRERIGRTYDRAFAGMHEAEELQRRSGAAEATQAHRESVPATLRRIEKLEADLRRVQRTIDGRMDYVSDGEGGHRLELVKPGAGYLARLESSAANITEQLAYWRAHVAAQEANGVKVWGPADFAVGDFVHGRWGWAEVLRVNAKSLTIPWGSNAVHLAVVTRDNVTTAVGGPGWRDKVTYDDVRGRKSAEEMAPVLAGTEAAAV